MFEKYWGLSKESLGERYKYAFVKNPNMKSLELLREIIYNLGIKDNLSFEKTDLSL